jgi:hypothetical protein
MTRKKRPRAGRAISHAHQFAAANADDAVESRIVMLLWKCLPAAGTGAAFKFTEIGTVRWQLCPNATLTLRAGVGMFAGILPEDGECLSVPRRSDGGRRTTLRAELAC